MIESSWHVGGVAGCPPEVEAGRMTGTVVLLGGGTGPSEAWLTRVTASRLPASTR